MAELPLQNELLVVFAVTDGKSFTVNVKGIEEETQPVVLLVTTKLKSYTPAAKPLVGIDIVAEVPLKVALVMAEKPVRLLVPAVIVYLSGLPEVLKLKLKVLFPIQTEALLGVTVGKGFTVSDTFPEGEALLHFASDTEVMA